MTTFEDSRDDKRDYSVLVALKSSDAVLDAYISARVAAARAEFAALGTAYWGWVLEIAKVRGL